VTGESRAKKAYILSIGLIFILLAASATLLVSYSQSGTQPIAPVYVGIAYGGTTVAEAKLVIDRVKTYTNLFILDSGINPISKNESAVKEVCDYAVNAGLNIIVNLGTWTNRTDWHWKIQFLNDSKQMYGDKFLGAYYDDEPAGIPLDWDWTEYWANNGTLFSGADPLSLTPIYNKLQNATQTGIQPEDYTLEAQFQIHLIERNKGHTYLDQNNIKTFTSDYALYWYDYIGGYDTVFAQLGLNQTVNPQGSYQTSNQETSLALLRGAATLQNKDWGAVITWKYDQPPYLDSGQNIYNEMVTAYNGGAKYILVFDYAKEGNNPYGGMSDEHFQALQDFWTHVVTKTTPTFPKADAVLVLPKDYGFGMRSPTDRIWGFWGPDDKTPLIWNNTQTLLEKYGSRLDIVYDDPSFRLQGNYSKVYFWNQTIT
jgi:hypothetical protein